MNNPIISRSAAVICLSGLLLGLSALQSFGKGNDQSQAAEIALQEKKDAIQFAKNQTLKFLNAMEGLDKATASDLGPVMLKFFYHRRVFSIEMKKLRKMVRSIMAERSTPLKIGLQEAYVEVRKEAQGILDKNQYKQFRKVLDDMAPMPKWGVQVR